MLHGSESAVAPKLASLDLSAAGMNASIEAPEGATVKKDSIPGAVVITAASPKGYAVSVMPFGADLAQEKKDCAEAPKKNCEVVSEAGDSIVMKRKEFGKDNFVVVVAAGDKLVCKTSTLEAKIGSRAVADSVLTTCHSLKMKAQ